MIIKKCADSSRKKGRKAGSRQRQSVIKRLRLLDGWSGNKRRQRDNVKMAELIKD